MTSAAPNRINIIIDRARHIIVSPASEWDRVLRDTATIAGLYKNYALIVAAIPAVFTFLSLVTTPFAIALGVAAKAYLLSLAGTAALAFIADFLAPQFKGAANQINAFKLVIFSATPAWVAGVFVVIPVIGGILSFAGALYSLYVLYLGVPKLLKVPQEKAGIFTVIIAVVGAIAMMVVSKVFTFG